MHISFANICTSNLTFSRHNLTFSRHNRPSPRHHYPSPLLATPNPPGPASRMRSSPLKSLKMDKSSRHSANWKPNPTGPSVDCPTAMTLSWHIPPSPDSTLSYSIEARYPIPTHPMTILTHRRPINPVPAGIYTTWDPLTALMSTNSGVPLKPTSVLESVTC